MASARPLLRMVFALGAFALLATACRAVPTATALNDDLPPLVAPVELRPLQATEDDRVNFSLKRSDVDCSESALTIRENTTVSGAHHVVRGRLGSVCFGRSSQVLVDAWKVLVAVTPPAQLEQISVFAAFSHDDDRGVREVAITNDLPFAGVQMSIDVNHAFTDDNRLVKTLVHQSGYVVNFAKSQYSQTIDPRECSTFTDGYVCYNQNSILADWAASFWTGDIMATYDPFELQPPDVVQSRCHEYNGFWDAYSATSPLTDFAESYTSYVLRREPESPAHQAKNDWFAARPMFVNARALVLQSGYGPLVKGGGRCQF